MIKIKVGTESNVRPLNVRKLRDEFLSLLDETATLIQEDFASVTATWDVQPTFETEGPVAGDGMLYTFVHPGDFQGMDKVFRYLDEGTPAHIIKPRTGKILKFKSFYKAKTKPGTLYSGPGGKAGRWRAAPMVHHPGIKARHFCDVSAASHDQWFLNESLRIIEMFCASGIDTSIRRVESY